MGLHVVILAGGKGSRFWPLSRQKKGKQFLSIIESKSLIESTIDRINSFPESKTTWVVGNQDQSDFLDDLDVDHILLEPEGKNTAASIGWAALSIYQIDSDARMLVVPADHFIRPALAFHNTIKLALNHLNTHDHLLTFGIVPTSPHTGYGYIEAPCNGTDILSVKQFTEKPNTQTALSFIESENYYWNSGIFVWRASLIINLLKQHLPQTYSILNGIVTNKDSLVDGYAKLDNPSIDVAILEKSSAQTRLIKASFQWSDIGSWGALTDFWDRDDNQNSFKGKVTAINSHGNTVYSPKKLVGLAHVNDLIVVDSDDAILVAHKDHDQAVKALYDQLDHDYQ